MFKHSRYCLLIPWPSDFQQSFALYSEFVFQQQPCIDLTQAMVTSQQDEKGCGGEKD